MQDLNFDRDLEMNRMMFFLKSKVNRGNYVILYIIVCNDYRLCYS